MSRAASTSAQLLASKTSSLSRRRPLKASVYLKKMYACLHASRSILLSLSHPSARDLSISPHADILLSLSIEALRQGQAMRFRVASGSMRPLLQVNDSVLIEPASTVTVGEIAAFETSTGLVIHRIVHTAQSQEGRRLLQMGDGEIRPEWIETESIVGRVTTVYKGEQAFSLTTPLARWYGSLIAFLRYQVYLHRTNIPFSTILRLFSRLLLHIWSLYIQVQSSSLFRILF